ncbi:hypothetical protein E2C01_037134 [Portunus trituberculatus]|uniref:Uncharacterized protein n=1 Tax=Portunus trituberculatus TaxID=210409 RepID=A0A5B7FDB5_PORTR|nr:hypothetical protein [Portunus trituberculatus]
MLSSGTRTALGRRSTCFCCVCSAPSPASVPTVSGGRDSGGNTMRPPRYALLLPFPSSHSHFQSEAAHTDKRSMVGASVGTSDPWKHHSLWHVTLGFGDTRTWPPPTPVTI